MADRLAGRLGPAFTWLITAYVVSLMSSFVWKTPDSVCSERGGGFLHAHCTPDQREFWHVLTVVSIWGILRYIAGRLERRHVSRFEEALSKAPSASDAVLDKLPMGIAAAVRQYVVENLTITVAIAREQVERVRRSRALS